MRSRSCNDDHIATSRRQSWGRLFATAITESRNHAGLSIDQAAEAAGMEASEWAAIEQGQAPEDQDKVLVMADAIHVPHEQIALWAFICQGAWQR
jgi:transcriptional regulator with XRE-family HTH domain